jgi:RimJ/RimL family protein N-acetyltransferase
VIETTRLRLREWNDDDVEAWARMNADSRVMEYFVSTVPLERSREQAALLRQDLQRNGYGWFVLERKDREGFAGVMALDDVRYDVPFEPRFEIGWRLPVESWGHGYATEAAAALLDFAFVSLGRPAVISMTAAVNTRSRRVMERIGMTRDPAEDFNHPRVPPGHRLHRHLLYRKSAP